MMTGSVTLDRYTVSMTRRTDWDSVKAKIESRVDTSGDCWLWLGSVDTSGYGLIRVSGSLQKVHRAYLKALGVDVEGKEVDHLCRVQRCCNPEHLEPVTHQVNVLRGIGPTAQNAAKTHCIRGHEFTPENTILVAGRPGHRNCRKCANARMRQYRREGRFK